MLPIKCHFWKESTTKQKFCLKVELKFVEQNCRTKNCDHCRKPINVGNAKSALHESSINCKKINFSIYFWIVLSNPLKQVLPQTC